MGQTATVRCSRRSRSQCSSPRSLRRLLAKLAALAALALCLLPAACQELPPVVAGEQRTAAPIASALGTETLTVQPRFGGQPAQGLVANATPGAQSRTGGAAEQGTRPGFGTTVPATPTAAPFPEPAVLVLSSGQQTAAVGSFCATGAAATPAPEQCRDAIGIPTPRRPLAGTAPLTGKLRLPVADTPTEFWLAVLPVSDGMELSGGPSAYRWWPPAQGTLVNLSLQQEATISVTLDPGLYVLHVFARWPALGQAHYGFLVSIPMHGGLLDVYPLRLDASWVYSATVRYSAGGRSMQWQGAITETVTAVARRGDASIFELRLAGHPLRTRSDETFYRYVALNDNLYRLAAPQDPADLIAGGGRGYESSWFFAWPLQAGAGAPAAGGGANAWQISGPETVTVPAGWYPGCYQMTRQNAGQAATTRWFCPGIGMARIEVHDGASGAGELWELAAAPAGTRARAEVVR